MNLPKDSENDTNAGDVPETLPNAIEEMDEPES